MAKSIDMGGPITAGISTTATITQVIGTGGGSGNGGWPIQGAGLFNRVGNRISLKSLHLVGQLFPTTNSTTGVAEYLRILVVYDKMPNGAAPAIADILADQDETGTLTTSTWSNMNLNNRDRFKILMDDRIHVPNNSAGQEGDQFAAVIDYKGEYNINRFIRLQDLETMFKASSTGQLSDVSTGNLWLVTIGNVASSANGYQLRWNARIRYTDC